MSQSQLVTKCDTCKRDYSMDSHGWTLKIGHGWGTQRGNGWEFAIAKEGFAAWCPECWTKLHQPVAVAVGSVAATVGEEEIKFERH